MTPPRLRTRLFAAILLLPLVALATATDSVGLRCRVTGVVLDACCCPNVDVDGDGDAGPVHAAATMSAADCCDRIVREVNEAPAELVAPSAPLPNRNTVLALVAFADAGALLRQNPSSLVSSRSAAPARQRPPSVRLRLVAKSAFLI